MHLFLQHFVFITLSIPAAEKAFSFLTEVRGEDCLSFYRGEKTLHLRSKKAHNCSRTTHISYDRDNASTLILFYGQFLQKILRNLFICPNHANTEICSDFSTIHSHSRDIAGFFSKPNSKNWTQFKRSQFKYELRTKRGSDRDASPRALALHHSSTQRKTARARLKKVENCEPSRLSTWSGDSYTARSKPKYKKNAA